MPPAPFRALALCLWAAGLWSAAEAQSGEFGRLEGAEGSSCR